MLLKNKQLPHYSSASSKDTDFVFPSFEQIKGSQVFVSLKKSIPPNPVKKQHTEENAFQTIQKQKLPQQNERKTIERTIKQLLKGKQQLVNYLESQKQFIQVLNFHDHQIQNRFQNRGKLASSLTQKKNSRIDTYTTAKKSINSHLSKVSRNNGKFLIAKSQALTLEVLKKQDQPSKPDSGDMFQKKQYETFTFNQVCSQENQDHKDCKKTNLYQQQRHKKHQKYNHQFQVSSKQNYHPGQQSFVMTSPKRKQLKLNEKNNFQHNSFHATKYGLAHFSPWAFPKNQYDTELCQNSSVLQDKKINNDKVFSEKSMNCQDRPTKYEKKVVIKKGQSGRKQNNKQNVGNYQKQTLKDTISDNSKEKQKNDKQTTQIGQLIRQNVLFQRRYLSLQSKKDSQHGSNYSSNVKIVKSSQMMILQSKTLNTPDIFASKQQAKQMFYPRKSIKFESSQQGRNSLQIEAGAFQTEINIDQRQRNKSLSKQTQISNFPEGAYLSEATKQNQLGEIKKTEQFLKEIILTKNSVSYANSRSISKKEFKKINQAIYQENSSKRSNVFITKNLLQPRVVSQKSPRKNQVFKLIVQDDIKSDFKVLDINVVKEKQKIDENEVLSVDQQKNKNIQLYTKKKAKTSLDNPLSDKTIYDFIQKSNTKCFTEASLNGFYLINESKIRNTRNSFVRRKRHSMIVKKKESQNRKQNDQKKQRRFSYSTEKQLANGNIYDMSILEQSKGFGIVNPLTKQLYKKYVSIVQNKR